MRFLLLALALWPGLDLEAQKNTCNFSVEKNWVRIPDGIRFTNLSASAKSFEWDFGDGTKSTEKDPVHFYSKSGIYHVSLRANFGKKTREHKMKIEVKAPEKCLVRIETQFGNMLVHLYDETPQHRDNFSKLAEEGFYQDLLFHRGDRWLYDPGWRSGVEECPGQCAAGQRRTGLHHTGRVQSKIDPQKRRPGRSQNRRCRESAKEIIGFPVLYRPGKSTDRSPAHQG